MTTTCVDPSTQIPRPWSAGGDIGTPIGGRRGVLVLDNHDSFTHNAVDEIAQLGVAVDVIRSDRIGVRAVARGGWRAVVLSPGPGRPEGAGIGCEVVRRLGRRLPILGICLGHQAVAAALGGRIVHARRPLHGTATPIHHRGEGVLHGLPRPFLAARYHSLVVDPGALGRGLEVTAWSEEGEVMALRHRRWRVEGVQFHPESHLTPEGPRILATFLRRAGLRTRSPAAVVR